MPFASRDYRQQHLVTQRPRIIGLQPQPSVPAATGLPTPGANPVLFNAVPAASAQATAPTQQQAQFYGGFGNFYGAGYQAAGGQADWWSK